MRYIRVPAGRRENIGAAIASGVVAACAGVAVFYLTRLLLAREPLREPEPDRLEETVDGDG